MNTNMNIWIWRAVAFIKPLDNSPQTMRINSSSIGNVKKLLFSLTAHILQPIRSPQIIFAFFFSLYLSYIILPHININLIFLFLHISWNGSDKKPYTYDERKTHWMIRKMLWQTIEDKWNKAFEIWHWNV